MADSAPPVAPSPTRSRVWPTFFIVAIIASVIGWLALLYVTRPPGPSAAEVERALAGVPASARVSHALTLPGAGGGAEVAGGVVAGVPGGAISSWDHVGGVVIVYVPPAEVLTVEGPPGSEGALKAAALAGGILSHAEDALRRDVSARIAPLGYSAEMHFGAP